jgi:hypothetical protein
VTKEPLELIMNVVIMLNTSRICPFGTAVAQWLRYCATNPKVVGSIPDGVSGFFIDIKSYRSHYGPGGSNQPLTEMSTRSVSWG